MSRVLRPINNRVLVKRVDAEDRSRGGIMAVPGVDLSKLPKLPRQ